MSADKDGSWQGSMGFAQFAAAGGEEESSDEGEEEEPTIKQQLIGRGMGSAHYAGGAKVKNIANKEVTMSSCCYLMFNSFYRTRVRSLAMLVTH